LIRLRPVRCLATPPHRRRGWVRWHAGERSDAPPSEESTGHTPRFRAATAAWPQDQFYDRLLGRRRRTPSGWVKINAAGATNRSVQTPYRTPPCPRLQRGYVFRSSACDRGSRRVMDCGVAVADVQEVTKRLAAQRSRLTPMGNRVTGRTLGCAVVTAPVVLAAGCGGSSSRTRSAEPAEPRRTKFSWATP
jgi:hypothetical protein